jgi:hypothetical protein
VEDVLLPPLSLIREQLARNQRERHRLRTLLRWSINNLEETARSGPRDPCSESAGHRPELAQVAAC